MAENIGIVGAGICGLCTALALASRGNQVTVYERDVPPPEGDPDQAFFEWPRRGAAQFRHPHAFLAVMCNLLEKHYPDLTEEFWAAGARKVPFHDMVPRELIDDYIPEPGDEDMWLLMCRRATMETVLRRYVEQSHDVIINNHSNVVGMLHEKTGDQIVITGLKVTEDRSEPHEVRHDIVVDASGRTTRFPEWFSTLGVEFDVEDDDADIVYYTRHYKIQDGEEEPSRHSNERSAGDLGYLKYGVFPGDNGHFAVILCLPNHEAELREAVKQPEKFQLICNTIPGLRPWVSEEKSSPTTSSFGFGDIHAVWRHFVRDEQPLALNYFAVGDAAVRTNPLYGRGCSTDIIHAHLLADILEKHPDAETRALELNRQTEDQLRPIFNASLREDKRGIKRARAIYEDRDIAEPGSPARWLRAAFMDAIGAAAREDLHVFRGAMRTFNLMEKPGDFLKEGKTRLKVLKYMLRGRSRNNQARLQRGPTRKEMLEHIRRDSDKAA
jgi:2-polyprenyl-6-methoxyphenol hydroxylase-like FAD-dependent oxidoreductase